MLTDNHVTLTEASRLLECDTKTLYHMIQDGKLIPYRKAGHRPRSPVWFKREDVLALAKLVPVEVPLAR